MGYSFTLICQLFELSYCFIAQYLNPVERERGTHDVTNFSE